MKSIKNKKQTRRGITLVEVTISSLLIGLLTVAAMKTTGGALRTWNSVSEQYDDTILAEQLLAEVLQASYEDPDETPIWGNESGETQNPTDRADFDDLDDYDDWSKSPPQLKDGTTISGFTGWTRSVIVQKLNQSNPTTIELDSAPDQGMRRVIVTVTDSNSNQTSVSGWRTTAGSPDQSKGMDGSFIIWMGCDLKIGSTGETISAGTNILNHATDQTQ